MILVDANVLIDIVAAQSSWTSWSQDQLATSSLEGLAINPVIYAEIAPCFSSKPELDQFLSDFEIHLLPITAEIAYLAARAHQAYRKSNGLKSQTLPDFFIGAHASIDGLSLLTRDPNRFRTYFPEVNLLAPN